MRRGLARGVAITAVVGSALLSYAAVGNGDIVAPVPVTVVTVTSPTGSGSGTATLQNTTTSTSYSVLVGPDGTCDPGMSFTVAGGNPITAFAANTTRNVTIQCPPRGDEAITRCLLHATNNSNGTPLTDFMGACLYGASPPTLTPLQTSLDFGAPLVGDFTERTLTVRNDSPSTTIRRVYVMTSDLEGNFQFSTPCNPDGSFCDVDLTSEIGPNGSFALDVKCRPQSPGTHTAQVYVGTDTFQLLSLGVTLTCTGTATAQPALALSPPTIEIPPVEVATGSAATTLHVMNSGGATLLLRDIRIVDVDTDAGDDWTYVASGACSGQITSTCMLEAGEQVDLELTFDPQKIGRRRATLLLSYRDTLDRTTEIPLDGIGQGATVRRLGPPQPLAFGQLPIGRTAELTVTLVNEGTRDAMTTITLSPPGAPFTFVPAPPTSVSPGLPRTLTVQCAPTSAGEATTTISIASPDLPVPLEIAATCEGTTNQLYANPSSYMLGEIRLNTTAPTRTVQFLSTDTGNPLTLAGEPTLEVPNPSLTLEPLAQPTTPTMTAVTIAPQAEGAIAATVVVQATNGQSVAVPIAAAAVTAKYLAADTLDLGTFCVDQPTTSSNLTLLSTGTATIELMPPVLGQSPSPFALALTSPMVYPHQLGAAQSAVVSVTPQRQRAAGAVADTLTWRTDVAGSLTASTILTARFLDTGAAIAPPALNFGEITVHLFTENGQRVVIQNCSTESLVLDPPNIRTPFSIDSPNFPTMLSPSESVAFSVGFHPTRVGTVMETLRITSPQLAGAPLEVVLVGTGAAGDPAPDAGIGSARPGDTSFYACTCNSSTPPLGGIPIVISVLLLLVPRRRRIGLR